MKKTPSMPDHFHPSEAELEILDIIWQRAPEPVKIRAVFEEISTKKAVGYTTVLKQIQRLQEKNILERILAADGSHTYRATVEAENTRRAIAQKMLHRTFGGSAMQLMLHALGDEKISPDELAELKNWLDQKTARP